MTVPSAAEPDPVELDEPEDKVTAWRVEEFIRLGFHETSSHLLATADADVHLAADLLGKGCPIDVAFRILF